MPETSTFAHRGFKVVGISFRLLPNYWPRKKKMKPFRKEAKSVTSAIPPEEAHTAGS